MGLNLLHLDDDTRRFMLEEVQADVDGGALYVSARLSAVGAQRYPELLREAVTRGDDASLAEGLRSAGMMNSIEQRRTPSGGLTKAAVPRTVPETLAEGEFNRFYARGLSRRALQKALRSCRSIAQKKFRIRGPNPKQCSVGCSTLNSCLRTCGTVKGSNRRLGFRLVRTLV